MGDYWEDNGLVKPQSIVVCAACRNQDLILCGARHWDDVMSGQLKLLHESGFLVKTSEFEQGFINQFGEFLTRYEAMAIVKENGQPFNIERNGGSDKRLFSEGLY